MVRLRVITDGHLVDSARKMTFLYSGNRSKLIYCLAEYRRNEAIIIMILEHLLTERWYSAVFGDYGVVFD